ncbi:hypothetical protein [Saccharophagus degradans]|uniref:hypothetical protein n=1 Tax=Saccharophagus degradans TaxID=86304 RepID=UPI00003C94A2|nr:hypothetical protein [Saccharophagus degradans]
MLLNVNTSSNSSPKAAAQSGSPTVLAKGIHAAKCITASLLQINDCNTQSLEHYTNNSNQDETTPANQGVPHAASTQTA